MGNLFETIASGLGAAVYYFKAAVSLAVSNPYFLGFTVILLLTAGKSLKLGRVVSAKG